MEITFLPLILLGAAVLLPGNLFLLCAVPVMDLGQSIGSQYLLDPVILDAYPKGSSLHHHSCDDRSA